MALRASSSENKANAEQEKVLAIKKAMVKDENLNLEEFIFIED
jgi:hypothetical protein